MKTGPRTFSPSRRSFLRMAGLAAGSVFIDPLRAVGRLADAPQRSLRSFTRPLKIGVLLPTSSLYPALGKNLMAGMRLYFDRFAGQARDRRIDLVPVEIGFGHGLAHQRSRWLIQEERVDLVVGLISSEVAARLRHLFEEHQTPLVVANAGANVVRQADANPYVVHNSLNFWQANWALGAWAGANLGRTAFVATSLYDSGYDALHAFRMGLESAGGEIAQTSVTHASSVADDLNGLFAAIKRIGPDFIFASYCGAPATDLLTGFARSGLSEQHPLVGSGFMVEQDLLSALGNTALGVRSVLPWASSLDTPENKVFVSAYTRQTGRSADSFALLGLDTAQLILKMTDIVGDGVRRYGSWRDALGHIALTSPRGRLTVDSHTHSISSPLYLSEIRGRGGTYSNAIISELDPIPQRQISSSLEHASPKTGWLNAYLSV